MYCRKRSKRFRNLFPKTYFSLSAKTYPSVPSNDNLIHIEDRKFSRISRREWYERARGGNWIKSRKLAVDASGVGYRNVSSRIYGGAYRSNSHSCDARRMSLSTYACVSQYALRLLSSCTVSSSRFYRISPRILSASVKFSAREE